MFELCMRRFFFFNDTATTEIYTLSLHDALPILDKMDGIASSKAILQDNPEMKILILTSFLDDEKIFPALEAGVKGYILKTSQAQDIAESVRKIAMGQDVISESVRVKIYEKQHAKPTLHDSLTAREVEVLKEIAKGLSNQEIGY